MHAVIAWSLVVVCSLWNAAGFLAVARAIRKRAGGNGSVKAASEPVSVLKPLNGADDDLYQNLHSFFEQDLPELQLVFGVAEQDDPAVSIVARLQREYPTVECVLVVHSDASALNPKVQNLLGMLPHARHDLLLISDSNVRAPRHYLRELVTLHARPNVGMVTNLFAGSAERTLGAALENVQLNGFCAAGSALPTLSGDAAVVGKSTLFSRAALDRLGGLSRLSCVLAEDFVLGKMFQNAGQRVLIAPTVLETPNRDRTLRAAFSRQLRWSMLRWRLRPAVALLEPLTSPLLMLPFAYRAFGHYAWLWFFALLALRDLGGWVLLRGWGRAWLPLLLGPLRELSAPAAWFIGLFKRHVSWQGRRLRLSAGTLLYAEPWAERRASAEAR
ncbi:MAG TPA: glycosyltransferase [Polyangiaceae bacterium]|nr:glycosyltransferase [Polyangiaceae bacterium]